MTEKGHNTSPPSHNGTEHNDITRRYKPIPALTEEQIARFWSKVDRSGECWIWTGGSWSGYGVAYVGNGKFLAHRVAYTILRGPIPEGLTLDHQRESGVCTSKLCCRDTHLDPVPLGVNVHRAHIHRARPTCKQGHPKEFGRRCKICAVVAVAKSQAKRPDYYRQVKTRNKREERARAKQRKSVAA